MRVGTGTVRNNRDAAVRSARLIVVALVTAIVTMAGGTAGVVSAHDDIESSTPVSRSTIDAPISEVEIDFGEVIGSDTVLFLSYGLADGGVDDLGGTTTITNETTAKIEFDEIDRQGTYFVQYLAPVPSDGHVIAGSISFTWGNATVFVDENPDIRQSSPSSRQVIASPISSATVEFELEVTDLTMSLIYDEGDGETFNTFDGVVDQTGPQTVTFSFDELPKEGTYFISYQGLAAIDGDEVAGAIPFQWGDPSSPESSFPWLIVVPISLIALAIGAWFSYKRMLVDDDDDGENADAVVEDDPELTSV